MASKNKSKHVVAIWIPDPSDSTKSLTKEYTFHYIPANVNFVSDDRQRVSLYRSPSRGSIIRVQSTELLEKKVDILYSGYVQAGTVQYYEASSVRPYYVDALLALKVLDKEAHAYHMEKFKLEETQRERTTAKREFIASCTDVGLILNKSQMLRIEKHFLGEAK